MGFHGDLRLSQRFLVYPTLRWAPPQRPGTGRYPVGYRMSVQVVLEQVRSYGRGTTSGTSPWRYS